MHTNEIKWEKVTKEWMKGIETIHCLQGANPVYHRGKGPLGGTLEIFFLAFCDVLGSPMNRQKKQRSFDWQEKNEQNMRQTAQFFNQNWW